ncbi:MAG: Na+/H+ antiporter subunit E [Chloroflexota bacterium]
MLLRLALLTLVYALVLGSSDPWDLAQGAVFSAALLVAFRRFLPDERSTPPLALLRRLLAFFPYALAVAWDIAVGTVTMILIVLHLRPLTRPGIVIVPIGERSPTGVAVSSLANVLSPGTLLVDVDQQRGVMLIHSIDASDPEAVRQAMQNMYYRWQRHVFP